MTKSALAFPAGPTGAALLILRASIAVSLIAGEAAAGGPGGLLPLLLTALAAGAVLGVFMRVVAATSVLAALWLCLRGGWPPLAGGVVLLLDGAVLALLGPGAFSIDGLRFGRRTVRLNG